MVLKGEQQQQEEEEALHQTLSPHVHVGTNTRSVLPRQREIKIKIKTPTYHVDFRHHVDAGDVYPHAHVHGGSCGQIRPLGSSEQRAERHTHGSSFTSKIRPQTDVITLQQLVHGGFHIRHVAGFVCAKMVIKQQQQSRSRGEICRSVQNCPGLAGIKKAQISPLRAADHRDQQGPAAEPAAPPVRHDAPHRCPTTLRSSCRASSSRLQLRLQSCY